MFENKRWLYALFCVVAPMAWGITVFVIASFLENHFKKFRLFVDQDGISIQKERK